MPTWPARLPFYYGWVVLAIAFVTMAIGVTARTAFSLFMPPLMEEFGWDRALASGAFSFGFLVSAALSPLVGRVMDGRGPGLVIGTGAVLLAAGLLLAPLITQPWHFYATLGLCVGAGANLVGFTAQSLFLPNWFVRRRGLAMSLAFSGVGVGAILLLPWLQSIIVAQGWRAACQVMGVLVLCVILPASFLLWRRPEQVGLLPDGAATARPASNIVDPAWAAVDWTLGRAARTARFWWIALAYFTGCYAWYAVQVHQTKYLLEVGFAPLVAGWALGIVSAIAIPGQISLGALSDRIGREWVWSAGCAGFATCFAALIALEGAPSPALLWVMVLAQGFFGHAVTALMGPTVAEIFEGRHYGAIFGMLSVSLIGGGAAGPWITGVIHDAAGSYRPAFLLAIAFCAISCAAMWLAAPRGVRLVPGHRSLRAASGRRPVR